MQTKLQSAKHDLGILKLGFIATVTSFILFINHDELFFTKLDNKHTNRISRQRTSTFQQPFSLNHANKKEQSTNIFECQPLNQHNSQNIQPFFMIQSSKWSAWKDLFKAHHDFENGGIRNLTKLEAQWWNRCCLVVYCWNRCCFKLQMMNEWRVLAQQPWKKLQSKSAMDEGWWNSAGKWCYSCGLMLTNASKVMVNDEATNTSSSSFGVFSKNSRWRKWMFWEQESFWSVLWKWLGFFRMEMWYM